MANNNKNKSLIKDLAILLSIWGPLLFIIIGGIMWKDDKFDGTIMEQLFPAMFFGFICAFLVVIILSNLFKYSSTLWWIGGIITFIAIVVCYMMELTSFFLACVLVVFGVTLLLALFNWITGK